MKEPVGFELIEEARKGSDTALAAVIAREMPMIRRHARRAVSPGLDFDDAVQEGLIGLFGAIESYRAPGKGHGAEHGGPGETASFSTYASICVKNAILTAQKAAGRKKHLPLNQSVPIPPTQSVPGPEEEAIEGENLSLILERARSRLSPLERQVLRLYLDGYSYAEIARMLGKSSKAVDNALARLRKKLGGGKRMAD